MGGKQGLDLPSSPSKPQHWDQKSGRSLPAALRVSSQRKDFMEVRRQQWSDGAGVPVPSRWDGLQAYCSAPSAPTSLVPVALSYWGPFVCPTPDLPVSFHFWVLLWHVSAHCSPSLLSFLSFLCLFCVSVRTQLWRRVHVGVGRGLSLTWGVFSDSKPRAH